MRKSHSRLQLEVSMESLVEMVRQKLLSLPDPRNRSISHTHHDIVMSGFAMFSLKYPSVNQMQKQTQAEQHNLQSLYKIDCLCSDTHLRTVFDQTDPAPLRSLYAQGIDLLRKVGVLKEYALPRMVGDKRYLICSIDGVKHFSSQKVCCDNCQVCEHSNGSITYSHSMLCAALVHPDQKEVFMMDTEPIVKQDGATKNDCEQNAAKRLLAALAESYKDYDLLVVEDALHANAPNLRNILGNDWQFMVNIKADSHKSLFTAFEARKARGQCKIRAYKDKKGVIHRFEYANNFALNDSATDLRVNVLKYEQVYANGKVKRFTWATSIPLHARNVERLMKVGRSRWKIENETFNTLKNQGYHFEHNYGHGSNHLATAFAFLMCLAFQVDQIFQRCSQLFKRIWMKAESKAKLWTVLKAIFSVNIIYSFKELYYTIAAQFFIQIE